MRVTKNINRIRILKKDNVLSKKCTVMVSIFVENKYICFFLSATPTPKPSTETGR